MRNAIVSGLASFFVFALIACGGSVPPPAAPPERPGAVAAPAEPTTVEEAQRQIDDASDALAGKRKFQDSQTTSNTTRVTEPTTAAESRAPQCVDSCRALASMRRAVTALCRLAGDTDARCTDAKTTLETSESRIATCHC